MKTKQKNFRNENSGAELYGILHDLLERRHVLRPACKEYIELDRALQAYLREYLLWLSADM